MLSTVSYATFILVLVLLLLNMAAGAEQKIEKVNMVFEVETNGEPQVYSCRFKKALALTELQGKATPKKVNCMSTAIILPRCRFQDTLSCQEASDLCLKNFEGTDFAKITPGGVCPGAKA